MAKLENPSVLAFERILDVSDAFFWQTDSQNDKSAITQVKVQEKSVRGTISNRLRTESKDLTKLDAETTKPNLQRIDSSSLDEDKDTLIVKFTCKILPFTGRPSVCNNQDYQAALMQLVADYQEQHGMSELAKRYAQNIANARWLWRNRVGAESIQVSVSWNNQTLEFNNAKDLSLQDFNTQSPELTKLADWIEQGLLGKKFVILSIEAHAKVGYGQEVYPSQELILDSADKKSKVLYRVGAPNENHAAMHSQKIGNAIRTIDNWYENAQFPIAVEPYGAVTTMGKAFRAGKDSFYKLFDNWVLKNQAPEDTNQQHYIMAILIRGGIFGDSDKNKNKK